MKPREVGTDALRVLFEGAHDMERARMLYGVGSYSSGCDELERRGITDHAGQVMCDAATLALLKSELEWRLSRNPQGDGSEKLGVES